MGYGSAVLNNFQQFHVGLDVIHIIKVRPKYKLCRCGCKIYDLVKGETGNFVVFILSGSPDPFALLTSPTSARLFSSYPAPLRPPLP